MKIYTSYFGNLKNIPDDIYPISIARYKPYKMKIETYLPLCPSASLLRQYKDKNISMGKYTEIFTLENLQWLKHEKVLSDLNIMSGGKDVVLLCYEKFDFCHREIVRKWFRDNGFDIVEYKI